MVIGWIVVEVFLCLIHVVWFAGQSTAVHACRACLTHSANIQVNQLSSCTSLLDCRSVCAPFMGKDKKTLLQHCPNASPPFCACLDCTQPDAPFSGLDYWHPVQRGSLQHLCNRFHPCAARIAQFQQPPCHNCNPEGVGKLDTP